MGGTSQYNPHVQSHFRTIRPVQTLSAGLSYFDLQFLGRRHAIATAVVSGPSGVAVIDPGPSTCLAKLELGLQDAGVRLADVSEILLTHIHLDHAGATGTLNDPPATRVVVPPAFT